MDGTEYILNTTSGLIIIIIIIGLYSTAGGNNKPVRDDPARVSVNIVEGKKRENKKKRPFR